LAVANSSSERILASALRRLAQGRMAAMTVEWKH